MSEYLAAIPPFFLFIFGAIFGSFANVVIYRLPKGESISYPGSHCYSCKQPVKWYHNLPILAWFLLRGKCASCKAPFSFRYPVVEFLMGAAFYLAYYFYGWNWQLLEILIFLFGLITVSFIDLDHYILPDVFTLSGIVIGLLGALLNPEREFLDAFLGVVIGGGFLWAIAYFYYVFRKEEGMGGGDIKLLAWIGAVLGWKAIPFVILTASIVGSFGGLWVAFKQRKGIKAAIPFGPYLALGAVLYLFGGQTIAQWYLQLFIPGLE